MSLEHFCLKMAALNGFLAVGVGAMGAHVLQPSLAALPPEEAANRLAWVHTGSQYQLAHAAALVALAALASRLQPRTLSWAAHGFGWGALIFSSTLYMMAWGGPHWLGAVTPLGGLGLLLGWAAVAGAAGRA